MLITRMETDKTLAVIPPREYERIKKARLTVLVSCLLNSSNLSPFVGLFLLPFLRTLGEQVVNSNVSDFY